MAKNYELIKKDLEGLLGDWEAGYKVLNRVIGRVEDIPSNSLQEEKAPGKKRIRSSFKFGQMIL